MFFHKMPSENDSFWDGLYSKDYVIKLLNNRIHFCSKNKLPANVLAENLDTRVNGSLEGVQLFSKPNFRMMKLSKMISDETKKTDGEMLRRT